MTSESQYDHIICWKFWCPLLFFVRKTLWKGARCFINKIPLSCLSLPLPPCATAIVICRDIICFSLCWNLRLTINIVFWSPTEEAVLPVGSLTNHFGIIHTSFLGAEAPKAITSTSFSVDIITVSTCVSWPLAVSDMPHCCATKDRRQGWWPQRDSWSRRMCACLVSAHTLQSWFVAGLMRLLT